MIEDKEYICKEALEASRVKDYDDMNGRSEDTTKLVIKYWTSRKRENSQGIDNVYTEEEMITIKNKIRKDFNNKKRHLIRNHPKGKIFSKKIKIKVYNAIGYL